MTVVTYVKHVAPFNLPHFRHTQRSVTVL